MFSTIILVTKAMAPGVVTLNNAKRTVAVFSLLNSKNEVYSYHHCSPSKTKKTKKQEKKKEKKQVLQ